MIKVSVITAVYNGEAYLEKCLESLINQTLDDIEIIVVNDGSTDGSQEILERYLSNSSRLKCYMKENGGAADARNYGLRFAAGEYVGYVDSDDFVDLDMYEVLYKNAVKNDADIVECNLRHTYAGSEDIEVITHYYDRKDLLKFGRFVVWNKIYRREWLIRSEADFPVELIYEDVEFIAKLVPYIGKYVYADLACVHYVQRKNSVNHATTTKTLDILQILMNVLEFYRQKGLYDDYKEALEYFFIRILLLSSFSRMCRMGDSVLRKMALDMNWRLLNKTFPDWKKNPTLLKLKSCKGLYIRTINSATYKVYSGIFPIVYNIYQRLDNKWK